MKVALVIAARQYACTHDELDALESHMAESIMPAKLFLLRLGAVEVGIVDCTYGRIKSSSGHW